MGCKPDNIGTMGVQGYQHGAPVRPIRNAEEVLPVHAVRLSLNEGSNSWVGQRRHIQEPVRPRFADSAAQLRWIKATGLVARKSDSRKKEVPYVSSHGAELTDHCYKVPERSSGLARPCRPLCLASHSRVGPKKGGVSRRGRS